MASISWSEPARFLPHHSNGSSSSGLSVNGGGGERVLGRSWNQDAHRDRQRNRISGKAQGQSIGIGIEMGITDALSLCDIYVHRIPGVLT